MPKTPPIYDCTTVKPAEGFNGQVFRSVIECVLAPIEQHAMLCKEKANGQDNVIDSLMEQTCDI